MNDTGSRILIVDDEEGIRFSLSYFLTQKGYHVDAVEDYTSALEALHTDNFDVIFADIMLKNFSGMQLLSEVNTRNIRCPVVLITGEPNLQTVSEAIRQGAFDYLPKPVKKDDILRIARQAVKHKALMDDKAFLEAETEESRRNLESIFKSVKDAIVLVDGQRRILKVNESISQICGLAPSEIVGQCFPEAMPHCSHSCRSAVQEVLHTQNSVDEYRVECRNQQSPGKVVLLSCAPCRDQERGYAGAVLVIRDVSRLTHLEERLKKRGQFQDLIGRSQGMRSVFRMLDHLKDVDTNVLITGESGTGKGVAARALHDSGIRAAKPFVTVNCSTLSENLLESELFGHVKGAFTGAHQNKEGRFQAADGGTVFLDEIGDISPSIQLKLLRFLQDREFERVGDTRTVHVDVRVIAATNQDLLSRVEAGEFRRDLYYRLKVIELTMPPLRERRKDIPILVDHFRTVYNQKFRKQVAAISTRVLNLFTRYPWPGNIRELEHAMEHAFVLCRGRVIHLRYLPAELITFAEEIHLSLGQEQADDDVSEAERIRRTLDSTDGNKAKAARLLGISRQTLYRKIREFGLSDPGDPE